MNDLTLLEQVIESCRNGTPVALATVTDTSRSVPRHAGSKMLVYPDGTQTGSIGGGEMESRVIEESRAALADGQARTLSYELVDPGRGDPGVCGGQVNLYIEPYLPQRRLVVVGCGHIGRAIVDLAHWLGYHVIATDDREDVVTAEALPNADQLVAGPISDLLEQVEIDAGTSIIVVTRNMGVDLASVPLLVKTHAGYIGVMGSQRRWNTTRAKLAELGVADADLDRLHAPIGLELNAETPEEIAVSILAEVVMHTRGGSGAPMSHEVT